MNMEAKGNETEGGSILDELGALGDQLSQAIRSLWESEESVKLRQEIGEGFVELGNQIDEALKAAQEGEAAKEFSAQVKETVERAKGTDVVGKLEEGLVTGLRDLNEQLAKWVESLQTEGAPESGSDEETE